MLTPQENPQGYEASSVVAAAGKLHGKLLILHGLMDDNVSIRNTVRPGERPPGGADKDFRADDLLPPPATASAGARYERLMHDFIRRLGGPREKGKAE